MSNFVTANGQHLGNLPPPIQELQNITHQASKCFVQNESCIGIDLQAYNYHAII